MVTQEQIASGCLVRELLYPTALYHVINEIGVYSCLILLFKDRKRLRLIQMNVKIYCSVLAKNPNLRKSTHRICKVVAFLRFVLRGPNLGV